MTIMSAKQIQLTATGQLRHFLDVEGLPKALLEKILTTADSFLSSGQVVKKVPLLRGKTVVNLFYETSTRTLTTFELAAKRLSADVLNLNISTSSTKKGESLFDTAATLQAMNTDIFVVRHSVPGAAQFLAQQLKHKVAILNAGDGRHAHPTQAMLDMYTIRYHKKDFYPLIVTIVGDILHSRVARSQIHALNTLGVAQVRVVAPKTLLPVEIESLGVHVYTNLEQGLKDADVVIALRLQEERMQTGVLPSRKEFFNQFGLTDDRLKVAKPDAIVMHPGPINRDVEIASELADSARSVILEQVNFGIAVRMAVMAMITSGQLQHGGVA